jgi:hypothetical protein
MPQLDFILSEKERLDILEFGFKNGCRIIPNLSYTSDKYNVIVDIEEYVKNCEEVPLLFLINNRYTFYPLKLDFFESEKTKTWFIKQRCGGPSIDFFSPIIGEKKENIIGPGYIGIYEYYFHDKEKIVPNAQMINIFESFKSYIKSISKPVKLTNRTFWVGKYTIEQVLKGKFKILPISGNEIIELV